ncbi:MAG: NACHT domain-containing protein [bacterium]|nr:NACHT domain-containing protein [bacterium]
MSTCADGDGGVSAVSQWRARYNMEMPIDALGGGFSALASVLIESISSRYRRRNFERARQISRRAVEAAIKQTADVAAITDSEIGIMMGDEQLVRLVDRLVFLRVGGADEQSVLLGRAQLAGLASRKLQEGLASDRVEAVVKAIDNVVELVVVALEPEVDDGLITPGVDSAEVRVYLETIVERLDGLTSPTAEDWDAYRQHTASIASHSVEVHGYLKPPDIDRIRRVPIEELFVMPELQLAHSELLGADHPIVNPDRVSAPLPPVVFGDGGRVDLHSSALVLGDPGAGKSTLLRFIAYRVAKQRLDGHSTSIGVVVALRDYVIHQRAVGRCSLLAFAVADTSAKFQLPDLEVTFRTAANAGDLVLCVDGLDEVTNVLARQGVVEAIEAFVREYPDCRVIATSRRAGYDRAPIATPGVRMVEVRPFQAPHIEEYADKWFKLAEPEMHDSYAESFCRDVEPIRDIASNPLMLALLCLLYVGPGHLPESRPEVYRDCADLMYRRWDAERDVALAGVASGLVRPAVEELAYLLISGDLFPESGSADRSAEITESALLDHLTTLLGEWKYDEDRLEAERAAKSFLRHCYERAWVLVPGPASESGEATYQFAHRTFHEYLAAAYLVRTARTFSDFLEIFKSRIGEPQWTVVLELALQMRSGRHPNEVSEFIDIVVSELDRDPTGHSLDVVLGTLTYLELRQSTIRSLARLVVGGIAESDEELVAAAVRARRENAQHLSIAIKSELESSHARGSPPELVGLMLSISALIEYRVWEAANRPAMAALWKRSFTDYRADAERFLSSSLDRDNVAPGDWLLGAIVLQECPDAAEFIRRLGSDAFISLEPGFYIPVLPYPESRDGLGFLRDEAFAQTLTFLDPVEYDWPESEAIRRLKAAIPALWETYDRDPVAAWLDSGNPEAITGMLWLLAEAGELTEQQLVDAVCEIAETQVNSGSSLDDVAEFVEVARVRVPHATDQLDALLTRG